MFGLKRILNPGIFQGKRRKKDYFEGWYFKCVDAGANNILSFIPGVSYGKTPEDSHSFIQIIDGSRNRSGYFRFPLSDFSFKDDRLDITIGENNFSAEGLYVHLENKHMSYKGNLAIENPKPYPRKLWNPGIMGPFSFLPFMECYHGIVHMTNRLSGCLEIDGTLSDFQNGSGYIEKDWGTSFPDTWVWVQSNHFNDYGESRVSFMLSLARIPFLGSSFTGLISFLNIDNKLYRFSTYNGDRVAGLEYDNQVLSILVEGKHHALNITVRVKPGNGLKAPKNGIMTTDLTESMTSSLDMYLIEKKGRILFEGEGKIVGVEISGDLNKLI